MADIARWRGPIWLTRLPQVLRSEFRPLPPQRAFLASKAMIRGYGGAVGGGKSRTGCETVFNECLDHPGLIALIARDAHTSIVETTKKTMLEQVIPHELITHRKASMGEDYIDLWNGSRIHFIGLDNPYRWYSAEVGYLFFDEAQEIEEEAVLRLLNRLRQPGMPHKVIITFNPSSPGHWLQDWFLNESIPTDFGVPGVKGSRREKLTFHDENGDGDDESMGDVDFVFAKATDNPYLPESYIRRLKAQPPHMRRRYFEGLWEYTEGNAFFDPDTLRYYEQVTRDATPMASGRMVGDVEKDAAAKRRGTGVAEEDKIRFKRGSGQWLIWKPPAKDHRYVMAIDVSSGGSHDFSGIQIISIEDFEQVAEFQGKLPPTEIALEAYRAGRIYNTAYAVPEITGGWGHTIERELARLGYRALYTRKIWDRLSRKWTDKTGWDTTAKSRAHMLDTTERVLREQEFGLNSVRTHLELATFIYDEKTNKPQARAGSHDDLVMSLAIAITVALEQPRQLRKLKKTEHRPQFSATGW